MAKSWCVMSSSGAVVCLTIGQSPRPDIMTELMAMMPADCKVIEMGVLDGLSPEQLTAVSPAAGEPFYVTRLADGSEIMAAKAVLTELAEEKLVTLAGMGARAAVLLCTGEFPALRAPIPLLMMGDIIKNCVRQAYRGVPIAVVVPNPGQMAHLSHRWSEAGIDHSIYSCSPYHETDESRTLCEQLAGEDADFIVLDCIGFTEAMARHFHTLTRKTILLPRRMIAAELGKQ